MCMDVRGFLRNSQFPRDFRGMFKHDDGRSMTPEEAREALFDELAKGHKLIPLNEKCGNPCQQSAKCAGFRYGRDIGGGCPGYEVTDNHTINSAADGAAEGG